MTDKKKVFTETAIRVRSFIRGIKAAESGWTFPENNELAENANWILERIKHNNDWLNFFANPGVSHQEIIEARRKLAEKVSCVILKGEAVNIESPVDNGIRRFKAEVMEVYEQCRNESMTMFDVVPELVFQGQTFATNIPKEYKEKLKDVTDLKVRKELMKEHDIAMGKALVQFTGMSQYILEINNVKGFDISLFEIGDYVAPAVPTQPEVKGNEMKHNDEAKAILEAINLVASNTNKSLEEMRLLHAEVMAEYNRIGAMRHPFSIPQSGMLYQQANGAYERPQPQQNQARDGFGQARPWPTNPVEPIPVDLGQVFQKAQGFSPVQAAQNAFNVQPNATYTSPDFIGAGFDSPPVGKVFTAQGEVPTGRPNSFNQKPTISVKELNVNCFMGCITSPSSNAIPMVTVAALNKMLDSFNEHSIELVSKVPLISVFHMVNHALETHGINMRNLGMKENMVIAFLMSKNLDFTTVQTNASNVQLNDSGFYGTSFQKVEHACELTNALIETLGKFNHFLKVKGASKNFNIIQACYIVKFHGETAFRDYVEKGSLPHGFGQTNQY